jgi:hypothetical protein
VTARSLRGRTETPRHPSSYMDERGQRPPAAKASWRTSTFAQYFPEKRIQRSVPLRRPPLQPPPHSILRHPEEELANLPGVSETVVLMLGAYSLSHPPMLFLGTPRRSSRISPGSPRPSWATAAAPLLIPPTRASGITRRRCV